MKSNGQVVMEQYLRSYLRSRRMARTSLLVVAACYGFVVFSTVDGWMPPYGLLMITIIFAALPIMQRWDRSLPPWWAYWGGTIILLPIDTDRKQEMRQWITSSGIPWYHPEDFVYHFQHSKHATLCKLMWGGK